MGVTSMTSNYEKNRINGLFQVDEQRNAILDAAETLFLQKGLENTTMGDIAEETGIHRATLYRYFADRDPIAFEIAVRMLKKISLTAGYMESSDQGITEREFMLAMIDHFEYLREAFRYLGMFNHLYGDRYPNETLANWFKDQVFSVIPSRGELQREELKRERSQIVVILNSIMSFMQLMAGRGELMASEQGVPINEQIKLFREIIQVYLDHIQLDI